MVPGKEQTCTNELSYRSMARRSPTRRWIMPRVWQKLHQIPIKIVRAVDPPLVDQVTVIGMRPSFGQVEGVMVKAQGEMPRTSWISTSSDSSRKGFRQPATSCGDRRPRRSHPRLPMATCS